MKWHGRTEVVNPGNTLYVTGLSTRVTERDLEEHFSKEGKVRFFTCFDYIFKSTVLVLTFCFFSLFFSLRLNFVLDVKIMVLCFSKQSVLFFLGCIMFSCRGATHSDFSWVCICYNGFC